MINFSKFLPAGEVEVLIIRPRVQAWALYFYLFLVVVLFFLLYPWWHLGNQGVALWFFTFLAIILFLINHLLKRYTYYLVSSSYIWHLFAANENSIRNRGRIPIKLITNLEAWGEHDILILASEQKFILYNIKQRDAVLGKLHEIILPKSNESVII